MSFTIHPSPRRIARAALNLGTAAALVATLGTPRILRGTHQG